MGADLTQPRPARRARRRSAIRATRPPVREDLPFSRTLWGLLRAPFRAVVAHLETELAAAGYEGIRRAHFRVLRAASRATSCSLTYLAKSAQITKQSAAYLVDHLEEHRYVESVDDPSDDRIRMIRLTARGQKVDREMRHIIERLERQWAAQIGLRRFSQFHRTLAELSDLITESRD